MRRCQRWSVLILVTTIFLSACRADVGIAPETATNASGSTQLRALQLRSEVANAGCGIVIDNDAVFKAGVLSRDSLGIALPSLDSLAKAGQIRAAFHVERFIVRTQVEGTPSLVTLACLLPYNARYEHAFARAIAIAGPRVSWGQKSRGFSSHAREQTARALAAELLVESLGSRGERRLDRAVEFARLSRSSSFTPLGGSYDSAPTGYGLASDDTVHAQLIDPVVVHATPYEYTIDNHTAYQAGAQFTYFDIESLWVSFSVDVPPDYTCRDASDFWFLQSEEGERMDSTAQIKGDITAALDNQEFTCKHTDGTDLCIDFFIMAERSAVYGGDDRDFDSEAGYRASRVQLYINSQTGAWTAKYNSSSAYIGNVQVNTVDSASSVWKPAEDVQIVRHPDGTIDAQLKFFNNYCQFRITCPSIDAKLWLVPDATQASGYQVYWKRDGMPSMGVYRERSDGTFATLAEDPEKIRSNWLNWLALIGNWKQSVKLPPGCNLQ